MKQKGIIDFGRVDRWGTCLGETELEWGIGRQGLDDNKGTSKQEQETRRVKGNVKSITTPPAKSPSYQAIIGGGGSR